MISLVFIIFPTLANTELLLVLLTLKSTAKFPKPVRKRYTSLKKQFILQCLVHAFAHRVF